MKKLTLLRAAIAVAAMFASVSANAEYAGGGPMRNNGQCFQYSKGMYRDGRFGSWGACPQTASSVRTTTTRGRKGQAAASDNAPAAALLVRRTILAAEPSEKLDAPAGGPSTGGCEPAIGCLTLTRHFKDLPFSLASLRGFLRIGAYRASEPNGSLAGIGSRILHFGATCANFPDAVRAGRQVSPNSRSTWRAYYFFLPGARGGRPVVKRADLARRRYGIAAHAARAKNAMAPVPGERWNGAC